MSIGIDIADQLIRSLNRAIDENDRTASRTSMASAAWEAIRPLELGMSIVPTDKDGFGLSFEDIGPVLEATGRHAAAAPVADIIFGTWLAVEAGLVLPEGPFHVASTAVPLTADVRTGKPILLPEWRAKNCPVLFIAITAEGERLCLTDGASSASSRLETGTPVVMSKPLPAPVTVRGQFAHFAAANSMLIAGALARSLDLSVEYTGVRRQFGKPLIHFQAVQRLLAQLATEVEAARAASRLGLRLLADDPELGAAISKGRSSAAASAIAYAHQAHGAIGVTDEHILSVLAERLRFWREAGGNEFFWADTMGERLAGMKDKGLWPALIELVEKPHHISQVE